MIKNNKEILKTVLAKSFDKADRAKFFFVKGNKKFSKTIIVKSPKKIDQKKVDAAVGVLRQEFKDPAIELLLWIGSVGGLVSRREVYKAPFFDTDNIKIYNPWRVCAIGEHWVIQHLRLKKNVEDVDGHCRKNPTGKDIIKGDEIDQVAQTERFKNASVRTSNVKLEDIENSNLYNEIIAGWTAYWNYMFKVNPPLHPNHVKALIATESSFDPKSFNGTNPKRIGPARGLMQLTEDTQGNLSGDRKELKDQFVILTDDEIYNPNKNICAGIRWLFRKRDTAKNRLKREPTWEEVLMDFKGRTRSQSGETKKIRMDLKKYLKLMGMN
ncbi:MAG: hypothetical protein A2504_04600 [Bdellovibrionales bacterium RIFOXYD12_FULL_39_22]|nr:MAG: hypothetical protein A2451_04760 [Bdellovibrionales bacterium RIFOXYC2_FULL_39_8]OFZ93572.1 MAG: hypothetical protein A2504_04600 [Bdellovibrionales bacterium RIFOXYD12_FULL_39_22]HLE10305.1 transglycosylase SLT domain-containing protein [Bacteriovoracaceae bacterium]